MRKREKYIDLAAGIMTVWVIVFHMIYPMFGSRELEIVPWLYFFMPWFFYKSGMMYHLRATKEEWKNSANKLLVTFAIWSFIGYLAYISWLLFAGEITWRNALYSPLRSLFLSASVPFNGALWFLPILFLVRGIGNWLLQNIHVKWVVLFSLLLSIFVRIFHWRLMPIWISGTLWGLFFFSVGYWMQGKETKPWNACFALDIYLTSLFTNIPSVYCGGQPLWAQILWLPDCVGGCITFNNLCRFFINVCQKFTPPLSDYSILQYIGRNSINFYVPHKIIFHIGFNLIIMYKLEWYNTYQGLLIVAAANIILLPIINILIRKYDRFFHHTCV